MKKAHLVLIIVTSVTIMFSAYSLAAMNQVYNINYEWYSQYNKAFSNQPRGFIKDDWRIPSYPQYMKFALISDKYELQSLRDEYGQDNTVLFNVDLTNNILLYGSLGTQSSPEYRLKFCDIAQRENIVEVKVSVNSPEKNAIAEDKGTQQYAASDAVRINKSEFPMKGKLRFIFKNQYGEELFTAYYYIK